jgi:NAD+ synthase (glutamine-hydrolysing)
VSNPIRVALAQINPLLGDCIGNAEQIYQAAHAAHTQGASLVLTPELALTGYPPEDLLLRPAFIADTQKVLDHLCQRLAVFEGLAVVDIRTEKGN